MGGFSQAVEYVSGEGAEGVHPAEAFEVEGVGGFNISVGFAVPVVPGDVVVGAAPGFVVVFAPDRVGGKTAVSTVGVPGVGIKGIFPTFFFAIRTVEPPGVV